MVSQDPDSSEFYFPIIMLFLAILAFLNFVSLTLDPEFNVDESNISGNNLDNISTRSPDTIIMTTPEKTKDKNALKFRYLVCYLIVRASMWSKAPYMFLLYLTYHKFHVQEIGILYIIDNLSGLIFAPATGVLTDLIGRKLFSIIYNITVIFNVILRLTGIKTLAYIAQILTGAGTGILNTAYESWVVCESYKLFGDSPLRQRFLKKLFKK